MKTKLFGKWKPDFWFFTKLFVILAMCLFIVYPFYTIITKSLFSNKVEGLTLYNFIRFFSKPYYYRALLRSIFVCVATVFFTTLVGVPIAYLMTRYNIAGKNILHIFIIMSLIFIGLYIFVPNTHVKFAHCIAPGILAGVAMQILQFAYINSQIWVSSYNAIYGSFAALPLFMLWIQISWTICLFGAELCYTSQNVDYYDLNATTNDISHRYRLMLCALLLSSLCKRHDEGGQPYSANELRDKTSIPIRIVNDLLFKMQEAKLICELSCDEKGEQTRFLPAISGDKMSVGLMIDRLESVGQWKLSLPDDLLKSPSCQKAVKLRSSYLQASRDILLRDL